MATVHPTSAPNEYQAPPRRGGRLVNRLLPVLDSISPSVGILGYHAVLADDAVTSPEMHVGISALREQLRFVRDRYCVLPLSEFVARFRAGAPLGGCLAVTFDDAYTGVLELAAPVLAALDLPITIFVAVDAAERGGSYWWDLFECVRWHSPHEDWPRLLASCGLPALSPTVESVALIREHLLAAHAGRLHRQQESAGTALRRHVPRLLHSLTFDQLRRLAGVARVEFGVHTSSHPALPLVMERQRDREIDFGYRRLLEELPNVIPAIAYPFGLYDPATVSSAARSGMLAGLTMQGRAVTRGDDVLTLPRLGVSERWLPSSIAMRLNPVLRRVMIARTGGVHPPGPRDPLLPATGDAAGESASSPRVSR